MSVRPPSGPVGCLPLGGGRRSQRPDYSSSDGAFTFSPPSGMQCPPLCYRPDQHAGVMVNLIVIAGISVFVAGMLALVRGLE